MDNLIKERIAAFRNIMHRENLNALYISGSDPHRSEYLPDHWKTRCFATGFSGSFGEVVITSGYAGLWTDTRYFLQAEEQLKETGILLHKLRVPQAEPVPEWLARNLKQGDRVGVEPCSLPLETFRNFSEMFREKNISIVFIDGVMDAVWHDRPLLTPNPVYNMAVTLAGASRKEKFERTIEVLELKGADVTLITALDDLAWTYNLRGSDISYNPLFYGFAIVGKGINRLFLREGVLTAGLSEELAGDGVDIAAYDEFYNSLSLLKNRRIYLDPFHLNTAAWTAIDQSCTIKEGISIPAGLKAIKNRTEICGFRDAMRKDGAALVRFLFWLQNSIGKIFITEYTIGQKLLELRSQQEGFRGESFPPIVGYAEHGAIVHWTVDECNALELKPEGILLVDSGGHYMSGTTDTTRSVALGPVTGRQKIDFTLALKGMIALSTAIFPAGTKGIHLDILARKALWSYGLNYGHGTGHGVGHFLSVHEGPAGIRQEYNPCEIEAGMIFSNEPGLYRTGEYGVRTENMMVCVEKQTSEFGKFLGFETLTLCPVDLSLIDLHLLTDGERKWLNDYHKMVRTSLSPLLTDLPCDFLSGLTREI